MYQKVRSRTSWYIRTTPSNTHLLVSPVFLWVSLLRAAGVVVEADLEANGYWAINLRSTFWTSANLYWKLLESNVKYNTQLILSFKHLITISKAPHTDTQSRKVGFHSSHGYKRVRYISYFNNILRLINLIKFKLGSKMVWWLALLLHSNITGKTVRFLSQGIFHLSQWDFTRSWRFFWCHDAIGQNVFFHYNSNYSWQTLFAKTASNSSSPRSCTTDYCKCCVCNFSEGRHLKHLTVVQISNI